MFDFISNDKISKSFFFFKICNSYMYNAHLIITYMFLKEKLQKLKKCSEIPIHSVLKKKTKKPPKSRNPEHPAIIQWWI